jgi:hypothetical protein
MSQEIVPSNLTLDDAKLVHVGLRQISGEQILQGEIIGCSLHSELKYGFEGQNLIFIFTLSLSIRSEEAQVAKLDASAVALFACPRVVSEADQSLVEAVAVPAMMITYPFLREAISEIARKINLPRISLGLLRAGKDRPESITLGDKMYEFDSSGETVGEPLSEDTKAE